jgi:hypothetical protein
MIVKIRIPRFASAGSGPAQPSLATRPGRPLSTFHAALTDSAEDWVVRGTPQMAFTPRPESAPAPEPAIRLEPTPFTEPTQLAKPRARKQPGPSPLLRAWSWLQTKYVQTATKRMRVAETVSLGEKRFVSIVSIEGREFLIGSGASGVTLLAQLSPAQQEPSNVGLRNIRGDVA